MAWRRVLADGRKLMSGSASYGAVDGSTIEMAWKCTSEVSLLAKGETEHELANKLMVRYELANN